jgi:ParB family chromosome partitioning protein
MVMSKILISEVIVSDSRRTVNPTKVKELAVSIGLIGLTNPILVSLDNVLIAGAHRLEACKMLGHKDIDVVVFKEDELHARLAEIDENLIRNELDYISRGELSNDRDEILRELGLRAESGTNLKNKGTGAESAPVPHKHSREFKS